jgi:hypothetical protein
VEPEMSKLNPAPSETVAIVELKDLISFIRENQGIGKRKTITADTLLERDLGITGDDGGELLEEIQNKFGVSFAGSDGSLRKAFGLAPDEYLFHSEGFSPFLFIASLLGFSIEKVKPLSVGQLYRVIVELKGGNSASATSS